MNAFPFSSHQRGRRSRFVSLAAALVSALLVMSSVQLAPAAAQSEDETPIEAPMTFLQGIGDRSVDVYINGKIALRGVSFASFSSPVMLPEGKHRIDLRDAGAKRRSKRLARVSVRVADSQPITVASYQRSNGKIKLYRKAVDTSWVNGESRFIVRNLANAPRVTMSYDGGPVFRDIAPGRSRRSVVPALPFVINITANTEDGIVPVLDPVRVTLGKNTVTVLYLVGDFENGTARAVFHAYRTPPMQNG